MFSFIWEWFVWNGFQRRLGAQDERMNPVNTVRQWRIKIQNESKSKNFAKNCVLFYPCFFFLFFIRALRFDLSVSWWCCCCRWSFFFTFLLISHIFYFLTCEMLFEFVSFFFFFFVSTLLLERIGTNSCLC